MAEMQTNTYVTTAYMRFLSSLSTVFLVDIASGFCQNDIFVMFLRQGRTAHLCIELSIYLKYMR